MGDNVKQLSPFGKKWTSLGKGFDELVPDKMKITNNPDTNKLLKPTFRKGWEFHAVRG